MSELKCIECGKVLTEKEKEDNDYIANGTGYERHDMCSKCWARYCHHAITGE